LNDNPFRAKATEALALKTDIDRAINAIRLGSAILHETDRAYTVNQLLINVAKQARKISQNTFEQAGSFELLYLTGKVLSSEIMESLISAHEENMGLLSRSIDLLEEIKKESEYLIPDFFMKLLERLGEVSNILPLAIRCCHDPKSLVKNREKLLRWVSEETFLKALLDM
jgi:hypothetical protein